jgi:hypothetical protein
MRSIADFCRRLKNGPDFLSLWAPERRLLYREENPNASIGNSFSFEVQPAQTNSQTSRTELCL